MLLNYLEPAKKGDCLSHLGKIDLVLTHGPKGRSLRMPIKAAGNIYEAAAKSLSHATAIIASGSPP